MSVRQNLRLHNNLQFQSFPNFTKPNSDKISTTINQSSSNKCICNGDGKFKSNY